MMLGRCCVIFLLIGLCATLSSGQNDDENDAEVNDAETNDAEVNDVETNDADQNEVSSSDEQIFNPKSRKGKSKIWRLKTDLL